MNTKFKEEEVKKKKKRAVCTYKHAERMRMLSVRCH